MLQQVSKRGVTFLILSLIGPISWADEKQVQVDKVLSIGEHFKEVEKYRNAAEINRAKSDFITSEYELTQAQATKELFILKSNEQIKKETSGAGVSGVPLQEKFVNPVLRTKPVLPRMEDISSEQAMRLLAVRADNENDYQAKIGIGEEGEWFQKHEMVGAWRIITISGSHVELFDEKTKQSKTLKFK
ncbi:MAG: hypothetical protein U9N57_00995 [Pseudomonadota bacterium]|nr:hypothetical protein [Pseudomonadota bacterium]